MVARVTLEIALRREFDYLIPPELEGRVEVGTRVKVPFGRRQVLGCVTGLAEQSDHESLKPIAKIIGAGPLMVMDTLVVGALRSKPEYRRFASSSLAGVR